MRPSHDRPGYHLGIDLGSTCTAAAVCRATGPGRPEAVQLGDAAAAIATTALLTADGDLLVGDAAQRRSATEPHRVARGFTRRIGDDTPLLLGDRTMTADEIAARFVRCVVDLVTAREGGAPDGVALTHPAGWGAHRRATLTRALAAAGIADVVLVAAPVAAALGHAGPAGLAPGSVIAVYDLGGDAFDAAVLRGGEDGTPVPLGRPVGIDDLGGVDFDEHVLDQVRDALGDAWYALDPTDPDVLAAVAVLRRACTTAKEALSADVDAAVPVMLPGTHTSVRIGRADFEDRIRPDVAETVAALLRALAAAGTDPTGPQTVLLVGGSSRIPLVPQLVSAGLGRPVTVDADPRTTVARGAALAAHRQARPAGRPEPVAAPAGAPCRPAVPHLPTPTPAWPVHRPRARRFRGVLVAALATTGIALTAAAAAYTLDPTLLSAAAPAALIGPAAAENTADVGTTDAENTAAEPEPPAAAPAPVAAAPAPARAAAAPTRSPTPTVRTAASATALARPAAPVTAASASAIPPASAAPTTAPTTSGTGTGGSASEPPPATGGSGSTDTPPASGGSAGSTTGGASSESAPTDPVPTDPVPSGPAPTGAP